MEMEERLKASVVLVVLERGVKVNRGLQGLF